MKCFCVYCDLRILRQTGQFIHLTSKPTIWAAGMVEIEDRWCGAVRGCMHLCGALLVVAMAAARGKSGSMCVRDCWVRTNRGLWNFDGCASSRCYVGDPSAAVPATCDTTSLAWGVQPIDDTCQLRFWLLYVCHTEKCSGHALLSPVVHEVSLLHA